MSQARGRPPHDDQLIPAEWAVVEWVRHGLSNPQIAELRGVSGRREVPRANALPSSAVRPAGAEAMGRRAPRQRVKGRRTDMASEMALGSIGQVSRTVTDIVADRLVPRRGRPAAPVHFRRAGVLRLRRHAAVPAPDAIAPGIDPSTSGRRHPRGAWRAESGGVAIRQRTAHDPPPRRRDRGMDGVLQRPRRTAAGVIAQVRAG